jgi:hypothetical protein
MAPKLHELFGVFFTVVLVGVARNYGPAFRFLHVMFQVLDERVSVLLILKAAFEGSVEYLSHRTEVFPNFMHFLDDFPHELQVGIILACEVKDGDITGLPVTIQTTVALFEPGGIPGDIEVEDESRRFL